MRGQRSYRVVSVIVGGGIIALAIFVIASTCAGTRGIVAKQAGQSAVMSLQCRAQLNGQFRQLRFSCCRLALVVAL